MMTLQLQFSTFSHRSAKYHTRQYIRLYGKPKRLEDLKGVIECFRTLRLLMCVLDI
jgi:hypothetical protein